MLTVRGPVPSGNMGITMAHDHVFCVQPLLSEYRSFPEPELRDDCEAETMREVAVSLENLWWIRQNWLSNRDNLVLDEEEVAVSELRRYRAAGGCSIIDPTVEGLGRNVEALVRVSEATDVNIVAGAGYYVEPTHPTWLRRKSSDEIAQRIIQDIQVGIDSTQIRAGFIGEIGCTWPMSKGEYAVLEASAAAQRATGAALMVHPGRNPRSPYAILDEIEDVGADPSRVILAHLDRTVQDIGGLKELGARGAYLEFDLFGMETSMYPFTWSSIDLPSDAQRLSMIEQLIEAGFLSQILISHDISTKHRLARYGGHGYDHIVRNIGPWMRRRDITEEEIGAILVGNPAHAFSITI